MKELIGAARLALKTCLGVRPGEDVLVVTDDALRDVGEGFYLAAKEIGAEAVLLTMRPREISGAEPPAVVAEAMKAARVVVVPTSKSLSHTRARRAATEKGARIATLPGATKEMLVRALNVDYQEMAGECTRFAGMLTDGAEALLTSPSGTHLSFSIAGRRGYPDAGIYTGPGSFGNLPAGEACIAPVEGTAEGVLVIDGSLAGWGLLEEPLTLQIRGGQAVEARGGRAADWLVDVWRRYGEPARLVAELGVGFNPRAAVTGKVLEDEKAKGTAHIALGDNMSMDGHNEAPVHLDGVIRRPTLILDGRIVMDKGEPIW
jgi:leucyl aminopeptidase (aminopeptidase T)